MIKQNHVICLILLVILLLIAISVYVYKKEYFGNAVMGRSVSRPLPVATPVAFHPPPQPKLHRIEMDFGVTEGESGNKLTLDFTIFSGDKIQWMNKTGKCSSTNCCININKVTPNGYTDTIIESSRPNKNNLSCHQGDLPARHDTEQKEFTNNTFRAETYLYQTLHEPPRQGFIPNENLSDKITVLPKLIEYINIEGVDSIPELSNGDVNEIKRGDIYRLPSMTSETPDNIIIKVPNDKNFYSDNEVYQQTANNIVLVNSLEHFPTDSEGIRFNTEGKYMIYRSFKDSDIHFMYIKIEVGIKEVIKLDNEQTGGSIFQEQAIGSFTNWNRYSPANITIKEGDIVQFKTRTSGGRTNDERMSITYGNPDMKDKGYYFDESVEVEQTANKLEISQPFIILRFNNSGEFPFFSRFNDLHGTIKVEQIDPTAGRIIHTIFRSCKMDTKIDNKRRLMNRHFDRTKYTHLNGNALNDSDTLLPDDLLLDENDRVYNLFRELTEKGLRPVPQQNNSDPNIDTRKQAIENNLNILYGKLDKNLEVKNIYGESIGTVENLLGNREKELVEINCGIDYNGTRPGYKVIDLDSQGLNIGNIEQYRFPKFLDRSFVLKNTNFNKVKSEESTSLTGCQHPDRFEINVLKEGESIKLILQKINGVLTNDDGTDVSPEEEGERLGDLKQTIHRELGHKWGLSEEFGSNDDEGLRFYAVKQSLIDRMFSVTTSSTTTTTTTTAPPTTTSTTTTTTAPPTTTSTTTTTTAPPTTTSTTTTTTTAPTTSTSTTTLAPTTTTTKRFEAVGIRLSSNLREVSPLIKEGIKTTLKDFYDQKDMKTKTIFFSGESLIVYIEFEENITKLEIDNSISELPDRINVNGHDFFITHINGRLVQRQTIPTTETRQMETRSVRSESPKVICSGLPIETDSNHAKPLCGSVEEGNSPLCEVSSIYNYCVDKNTDKPPCHLFNGDNLSNCPEECKIHVVGNNQGICRNPDLGPISCQEYNYLSPEYCPIGENDLCQLNNNNKCIYKPGIIGCGNHRTYYECESDNECESELTEGGFKCKPKTRGSGNRQRVPDNTPASPNNSNNLRKQMNENLAAHVLVKQGLNNQHTRFRGMFQ